MACGKAVDCVIVNENFDVVVSSAGVDEMVAAFGQAVAITRKDKNIKSMIGKFNSRGYGDGAPV